MGVTTYKELVVWERAMQLVVETYRATQLLPPSEQRGLAEQLRRASVSIPSNIAEGHARAHRKEFLHFLSIARASTKEVETQLLIAVRLGYLAPRNVAASLAHCEEVSRMLHAMRKRLGAVTP